MKKIVLSVFFLLSICFSGFSGEDETLDKLIDQGYLQIDYKLNAAYIATWVWVGIDAQTKKGLSRAIAFYCGNKKGTHLNWVDIYDMQTGKKIAKYSESWGFTVY